MEHPGALHVREVVAKSPEGLEVSLRQAEEEGLRLVQVVYTGKVEWDRGESDRFLCLFRGGHSDG